MRSDKFTATYAGFSIKTCSPLLFRLQGHRRWIPLGHLARPFIYIFIIIYICTQSKDTDRYTRVQMVLSLIHSSSLRMQYGILCGMAGNSSPTFKGMRVGRLITASHSPCHTKASTSRTAGSLDVLQHCCFYLR